MCPTVQRRRRRKEREREDKEVAIGTVVSSSEKQFSSPGSQVFNPFHGGIEANVSLPVCVSATFFFPSSFVPSTYARTHARTRWWPPRETGRRNANSELLTARFQCPRSRCYSCPWITLERLARILLEFAYRPWNWKSFPQTRARSYVLDAPVIRRNRNQPRIGTFSVFSIVGKFSISMIMSSNVVKSRALKNSRIFIKTSVSLISFFIWFTMIERVFVRNNFENCSNEDYLLLYYRNYYNSMI